MTAMNYRRLGRSGLKVSELSFGSWVTYGNQLGGDLAVIAPEGKAPPALAEQVILVPPHCDPTVNLYESYHVVKGDTLVEIWPVTARGRSR